MPPGTDVALGDSGFILLLKPAALNQLQLTILLRRLLPACRHHAAAGADDDAICYIHLLPACVSSSAGGLPTGSTWGAAVAQCQAQMHQKGACMIRKLQGQHNAQIALTDWQHQQRILQIQPSIEYGYKLWTGHREIYKGAPLSRQARVTNTGLQFHCAMTHTL
jgi:hypothetical protein